MQAALDELRREVGTERVELGELVVLGVGAKLSMIRALRRDDGELLRRRLADHVRSRRLPVEVQAADEVRRTGWARP